MRRFVPTAGILALLLIVLGVAGTAHEAAAANPHIRFVDNGNGTITDNQSGLMWEKKTESGGGGADLADPRNVDNRYTWSSTGAAPDGTLFTDFLAKMNCEVSSDGTCGLALAGFTDWCIPTIAELRTILTAESPNCSSTPCIDPIFGPTAADFYWSSTSSAGVPAFVWLVGFNGGDVAAYFKDSTLFARAVRGGP
jgi:hypothetical protein